MRTLHQGFRTAYGDVMQSMLVEDGRIVFREPGEVVVEGATIVPHHGRLLIPSYVDSHCHILPTGLDLQKLHLGKAGSQEEVLELIRGRQAEQPEGWLQAVHYDQNRYQGHLSRQQLDAIAPDRPVLLRHVSGHASVANTKALELAGVGPDTQDPAGGTFVRDASGDLTGVLLEDAHEHVSNAVPLPTLEEMVDAILRAGESMRSYGICCASDMMTGRFNLLRELEAYQLAHQRGNPIAVRLYLQWGTVFGKRGASQDELAPFFAPNSDPRAPRISGIKIFADGAIGSATAAIYGNYTDNPREPGAFVPKRPPTDVPGVSGTLIYRPEKLKEMVQTAAAAGHQVSIHSIGDYATDLVLDAFASTDEPTKHRIEHAMLLSDEQIDRMANVGCYVNIQPEFLFRFGQTYRRQLGDARAAKLNRVRSIIDAGLRVSFSSDRPIVAGHPIDGIRSATRRPAGFDPSENCAQLEALAAYTFEGSRVNGDGDLFGSLEPGSLADFHSATHLPN